MASGIGQRFFNGNPLRTLIWLAVVSVLVGFVFVTLGVDPVELALGVFHNLDAILDAIANLFSGFLRHVGRYFLVGVIVVVPIWLIARLVGGKNR